MELLIQRAKSFGGSVVLPEGQDPRVMKAAAEISRRGFARVVVLASPEEAQKSCAAAGVSPTGFEVVDPANAPFLEELIAAYLQKRAARAQGGDRRQANTSVQQDRPAGSSDAEAREALKKRLYVGAMMVETGRVSGMV
ncbi:MAG TPA: hypothetical protein DCM68_06560, partial [Verrucomicrobia bacterium]|nr:hypothetical protein [Verrucomicrobiota bacterium]